MIRVEIEAWEKEKAVADWKTYGKSLLIQRLKTASPSMGQTERKRLVRKIMKGDSLTLEIEDAFYANSVMSFLASHGAVVRVSPEDAKTLMAATKSDRKAVPS